jgi:hypothetical protein
MERPFRAGPIALSATPTTNIFNPGTTTGGVNCTSAPYDKLRVLLTKVTIVNKTAGAVTCSLWLGATGANAAGTEFLFSGTSIPANSAVEKYCEVPLDTTDFIVGGAGAGSSLTFEAEGILGVA